MLARSWPEHRYRRVAVLAPMVSCQAMNLCQCVSSVRAGVGVTRYVRFDADAGSKAQHPKNIHK
jgi:hypothetical protein